MPSVGTLRLISGGMHFGNALQESPITANAAITLPPSQPRAIGTAQLASKRRAQRSALATLRTAGCLKLLFPRCSGTALEAVLVNTAGGVTGGDQLQLQIEAGAHSHLRLTSQAAERFYHALPGETGRIENRLRLAAGARLDWLPQETILFDHSSVRRQLSVEMAEDARLLSVESLIFGRHAMAEQLRQVDLQDHLQVRRGDHLAFADAMHLNGDLAAMMQRDAIGAGAGAMASVLLVGSDAECAALLPQLRALLPESGGASLLRPGVLFLRLLAADSHQLRQVLIPALTLMNGADLPRPWTL